MYGIENYYAFVLACIILNITPGADTIYVLTRSISQGRKAGVFSVLGIITGVLVHILLAVFGLSAVLAKSIVIFTTIKWIGAGYLFYLGIKMLISKSVINLDTNTKSDISTLKIYRQGFLTNVLNPKVALFFLSLLPQFVSLEYINTTLPYLILGFTFVFTGTLWCLFVAISASKMTQTFRAKPSITNWMQKISGGIFMILGLQLLFVKDKVN